MNGIDQYNNSRSIRYPQLTYNLSFQRIKPIMHSSSQKGRMRTRNHIINPLLFPPEAHEPITM